MGATRKTPLGRLLLDRFKWFDECLLASLQVEGGLQLSHSESVAMAYLSEGDIRIAELARQLGITRQSAQKTVGALRKLGLVITEIDPANASARLVKLTAKGLRSVESALSIFARLEQKLSEQLGNDVVRNLRAALELDWGPPLCIE